MSTARSFLAIALVLIAALTGNAKTPASIGEQLSQDNPAVISYLEKLAPEKIGKKLKGLKLSDGTVEFKGATFVGMRVIPAKKQHIYVVRDKDGERAYVWIDKGGKDLVIPKAAGDDSGENAYVLSGDIYTFGDVAAGDGIVILSGGTLAWMNSLRD
jgi:hypothetical protein